MLAKIYYSPEYRAEVLGYIRTRDRQVIGGSSGPDPYSHSRILVFELGLPSPWSVPDLTTLFHLKYPQVSAFGLSCGMPTWNYCQISIQCTGRITSYCLPLRSLSLSSPIGDPSTWTSEVSVLDHRIITPLRAHESLFTSVRYPSLLGLAELRYIAAIMLASIEVTARRCQC